MCHKSRMSRKHTIWPGFSLALAVALLAPLTCLNIAGAARAIPDANMGFPVHIEIDGRSTGSGFYLNTEKVTYLVTARHVLYDESTSRLRGKQATLRSYGKDPKDKTHNLLSLNLGTLEANSDVKAHSVYNVAIVRTGTRLTKEGQSTFTLVGGVSIINKATSGLLAVSSNKAIRFDQVLVGNDVYIFGYPSSLGIKNVPQIDYERPLLRKGIIAGLNEKTKTIILDCPVYGGNSGGPVLQVEETTLGHREFRLIGIVKQFVPYAEEWLNKSQRYTNITLSNSGYSVAESVDAVFDLIGDQ